MCIRDSHKSILGYVNERAPEIWDRPRLWLDVGDKEGHRTLHDAEVLNRRLKANGWRPGEKMCIRDRKGAHPSRRETWETTKASRPQLAPDS